MIRPRWRGPGGSLEGGQCSTPEVIEVDAELREPRRVDRIDAPGSFGAVRHQPGILQDAQVLGDRGPADRHLLGELADGAGGGRDTAEDGASGRVDEGVPGIGLRGCVSGH